jgi:hypothetical protein
MTTPSPATPAATHQRDRAAMRRTANCADVQLVHVPTGWGRWLTSARPVDVVRSWDR